MFDPAKASPGRIGDLAAYNSDIYADTIPRDIPEVGALRAKIFERVPNLSERLAQTHIEQIQLLGKANPDAIALHQQNEKQLIQEILDAKKALWASEEGKQLLTKAYAAELADSSYENAWFIKSLKVNDSIPKMLGAFEAGSHHDPVRFFTEVLNGRKSSWLAFIEQAHELSYIEGKPLAEAMQERLKAVRISDTHVKLFSDLTAAYEKGEHEQFLAKLYEEHKPELDKLKAAAGEAATRSATQGERVAVGEGERLFSRMKNMSGKGKLGVIGGTVAVLGTVGYWVWQSKHKDQRQEVSQQQVAR